MAGYKTPGVYIKEVDTMSGTISAVETALPAFIGYTEKSKQGNQSLYLKPTPISSMMEYVSLFGKGFDGVFGNITDYEKQNPNKTFPLYDSMQMFFKNGGGDCYIASVGNYGDVDSEGYIYKDARSNQGKDKDDFTKGLNELKDFTEPTMVVIPDAVFFERTKCEAIQSAMMEHCGDEEVRNRVAILDVYDGYTDATTRDTEINNFRNNLNQYLDFGAAYYPWLNTTLYNSNNVNYNFISNEVDSSIVKYRVAMQAVLKTELGLPASDIGADKDKLVALSKVNPGWADLAGYTGFQEELFRILEKDTVFKPTIDKIKADGKEGATAVLGAFNEPLSAKNSNPKYPIPFDAAAHEVLLQLSTLYLKACKKMEEQLNQLPPSPIMAGIYTYVDNNYGVGQAPANFGITGVQSPTGPTSIVTSKDQEDLNIPLNGKAINAIRYFKNKGTLIWGARTLLGNSGDWRYINVRRSVIMIETSIKLALEAYVFKPNTLATWIDLQTQITAFLVKQWNAGILVGSSQDQAFIVDVGIGTTMTSQDVIDGIMKISIKLAVTRPAEFIEVTFEQMMPTA